MRPSDKAKLIAFYEAELASYGPQDPRSLHWSSVHTQQARFQALYELGPWDGVSVGDIGCGLGDFCGFLQGRGHTLASGDEAGATAATAEGRASLVPVPSEARREVFSRPVRYIGYDISPKMVADARHKYPSARFLLRDILEEGLETPCDYVVASGTFNIRIADHQRFFEAMLAAMYRGCLRAVAFNFLGPVHYDPLSDGLYFSAEPEAVMAFCRTLSPYLVLKDSYLPSDYTVYIYKSAVSSHLSVS